MRIYYAHCIALYSKPVEARDVVLIDKLFSGNATLVNPSDPEYGTRAEEIRTLYENMAAGHTITALLDDITAVRAYIDLDLGAGEAVMDIVFRPLVESCDALVFRANPDGSIPAGVAKEIMWALTAEKPVLELPRQLNNRRFLTVEHTRAWLQEIGQR